ncbi:MAG: NADH-quinone oxidoreductase subunit J family protein [Candidatus Binatia bacterium]
MTAPLFFFFLLGGLSIVSSLLVIFQRNVVHSALSLVATLFLVAVLFLTLEAPMIAVLQIFVYAGAIMVLFLFLIMFLNPTVLETRRPLWWGLGFAAALLFALELVALLPPSPLPEAQVPQAGEAFGSPEMIAHSLFTRFVLPFEIASVLLLIALIGAVVLAKREV